MAESQIFINNIQTPFGELILGSIDDKLCLCDWFYRKNRKQIDERVRKGLKAEFYAGETSVIKAARKQLLEYMKGKRTAFEVPLILVGSEFQKSVWNELMKIPFGETMTYYSLAERLSNAKAIRAIAAANGANAISIIVPCHRIIGSGGKLVGYAGGLYTKKKLLQLEAGQNSPVQMELFD